MMERTLQVIKCNLVNELFNWNLKKYYRTMHKGEMFMLQRVDAPMHVYMQQDKLFILIQL